jgi:hypothetical protein
MHTEQNSSDSDHVHAIALMKGSLNRAALFVDVRRAGRTHTRLRNCVAAVYWANVAGALLWL